MSSWRRAGWVLLVLLLGCRRQEVPPGADPTPVVEERPHPAPLRPEADEPRDLSIFYSADLRGRALAPSDAEGLGGLTRRATIVDQARNLARSVVVVDAGDFLPAAGDEAEGDGGNGLEQRRKLVLASYKRIGVSVITPGERELELGVGPLVRALRSANVRAVATNLVATKADAAFEKDALVESEGLAVGVFGIVELPPEGSALLDRIGLAPSDSVETARASVQSLRERGARVVVGLLHVAGGRERATEIAKALGDVDVLVLGHGPADAAPARAVMTGRTRIVYAGANGTHLGRIDARSFDAGGPSFDDRTLALTRSIPDQPGVSFLAQIEPELVKIAADKAAAAERRKKGQKDPEIYENWGYGSNGACALCHTNETAQWKTTEHAHALATLKKVGHDRDPACLGCHTTGYLQRGGTRYVETAVKQFSDVGCESCHGASVLHIRSIDKKKGTSRKVEPRVCFGCHTPDQNLGTLDYAASLPSILGPGHGAPADK